MSSRNITPVTEKDTELLVREVQSAVSASDVVKYHTDGIKIVPLAVDDPVSLGCGIATKTGAAGDYIEIVKRGVTNVNLEGTANIAIGDILIGDDAVAGALMLHTIATTSTTTVRDGAIKMGREVIPLAAQTAAGPTATMCQVNFG